MPVLCKYVPTCCDKYLRFFFLIVPALPKGDVIIEGLDASYYTGDLLTAKCTSPAADPPPTITWYINNQPVMIYLSVI